MFRAIGRGVTRNKRGTGYDCVVEYQDDRVNPPRAVSKVTHTVADYAALETAVGAHLATLAANDGVADLARDVVGKTIDTI